MVEGWVGGVGNTCGSVVVQEPSGMRNLRKYEAIVAAQQGRVVHGVSVVGALNHA